jgi:hypothetical protein
MGKCDHDWWDEAGNPGYEQCSKCWEYRKLRGNQAMGKRILPRIISRTKELICGAFEPLARYEREALIRNYNETLERARALEREIVDLKSQIPNPRPFLED